MNMDKKQLGLRADKVYDDDEKEAVASLSKEFKNISVKWDALELGVKVGDFRATSRTHKLISMTPTMKETSSLHPN